MLSGPSGILEAIYPSFGCATLAYLSSDLKSASFFVVVFCSICLASALPLEGPFAFSFFRVCILLRPASYHNLTFVS